MAGKSIDLNMEAKHEKLDLMLRLGQDKGKKPIEDVPESKKRKRNSDENVSTDRSPVDRISLLEQKLSKMEKMLHEINIKVDKHFIQAAQFINSQQAQSIKCLNEIHSTLQYILYYLYYKPTYSQNVPYSSKHGGSSSKPPRP